MAAKRSLQAQGVPVPDRLRGPNAPAATTQTRPTSGKMASRSSGNARRRNTSRNQSVSDYSPVNVAEKSGGSVGALEAEFLVALGLLIMLLFTSQASFADKIMSTMKRGALTCLLFFILALVAGAGPNAAKIAKAFGALVIIAILVTSPMNTAIKDFDKVISNDWQGTSETGGNTAASADSGSSQSTNSNTNTSNLGQDFINAIENELKLQGQKGVSNPASKAGIVQNIKNGLNGALNGIIPGSGSFLSKLGF